MEEWAEVKEWFVTHDGKHYGPVSFVDLRFAAERGELDLNLDLVWKACRIGLQSASWMGCSLTRK
jgi:hypothetical protein